MIYNVLFKLALRTCLMRERGKIFLNKRQKSSMYLLNGLIRTQQKDRLKMQVDSESLLLSCLLKI